MLLLMTFAVGLLALPAFRVLLNAWTELWIGDLPRVDALKALLEKSAAADEEDGET